MKTDHLYRSVLALFGFVFVCSSMSASRWLAAGVFPLLAVCCPRVWMQPGHEMHAWLTIFTYGAGVALLVAGFGVLLFRLCKTRHFVADLRCAAVAILPDRLSRLVEGLGLAKHVVVLVTEVPLAFCYGFRRPRICISTGLAGTLTDRELKAVLLHEDHHRRRYDPLRGLAAEVFAAMFFFLPIATELRDLFLTATEIEADRYAARLVGRPSLAGALYKLLTHPLAVRLSAPGIAGLSATEVRIAELLGERPIALRLSARSLVSSSAIIMLVCMLVL